MGDRILIRPIEAPKLSEGGIHIPDNATPEASRVRRGKVLAVGKGDRLKDGTRALMYCRPGDEVLYTSNPNQDWEMEFEKDKRAICSVINEEQFLLAILDPK